MVEGGGKWDSDLLKEWPAIHHPISGLDKTSFESLRYRKKLRGKE